MDRAQASREPRAFVILLALGLALPGAARADVTEYFGAPAPVEGSTVIPERVADETPAATSPATLTATEPAPPAVERPVVVPSATEAMPAEVSLPAGITPEPAALPTPAHCATPVEIVRVGDGSNEHASLVLLDCDGHADSASLRELSLLGRPSRVDRPSREMLEVHEADTNWVGPRVRRLHAGLLDRLRAIADHFPGHTIEIVSGYRPDARDGSRHRLGRAIDLRVRDVAVADLEAFLRTLDGTGVGLYPTTDFVHVDVRSRSAHWIDVSGPGEPPSLVREELASEPAATEASPASEEVDAAAVAAEAAELLEGFTIDLN